MANTLLTPKVYANTLLALLKNQLVMGKLVTSQFKNEYKNVGNTVYIKRPPEFIVRTGNVANVQDVVQGEVPVVIDTPIGVDVKLTDLDDTLTLDELGRSAIMKSAAVTLAQAIDSQIMSRVLEFPNWVGTPGNTIDSVTDFFKGPERLDDLAVPQGDRNAVLATRDYWAQAGSMVGLYQYNGAVAQDALTKARLPIMGDVNAFMTQSVQNITTGTRATSGSGLVNGANQNVAYTAVNSGATSMQQTLITDGWANGATFKKGEVFTVNNVYAVNPRTKAVLDFNAQFVLLADAVADGSGNCTFTIANPMIKDGAYQSISAAPADNATITFLGAASTAYRQNAVFHKSAIALVFAKQTMPATGMAAYATDPVTGVNIRYWRFSDGITNEHYHRWDALLGTKNIDRRLGARLSGTP